VGALEPMITMQIPLSQNSQWTPQKSMKALGNQAEWVGLRFVQENTHSRSFRNGKPEDNIVTFDSGVMVEVFVDGHFGYCGTSDFSEKGLQNAFDKAKALALSGSKKKLFPFSIEQRPKSVGTYRSPVFKDLDSTSLQEISDLLKKGSEKLKASDKIVNTEAGVVLVETKSHFLSSNGSDIFQEYLLAYNHLSATAQEGSLSQTRSLGGGRAKCMQTGMEFLDAPNMFKDCDRIGKEALELLAAPNCPTGTMDLLLHPDQMLLQIHESIGHPLELDRILGDERNFAGWSFVEPKDFGSLQYGAKSMNVTFDPSVPGEYASYAFDDGGNPAKREFLIKDGVLQRGLGSLESQIRSDIPGVANFRASSWNRAPIDRMANINLEPGTSSLQKMIESTERGIFMQANNSWSIDDYRRKFQFGCEFAQMIENGKLTHVVRNPNYRGITVPFWNSLKAIGNATEVEMYGSPFCGKGEPSQVIRVGHAAPPCLFENIEVFGGVS
jgi:predicted Zn-dependent protease